MNPDISHNGQSVEEYLAKIKETIRKANEVLENTRKKLAESDEIYKKLGISRDDVETILNDPNLPPEVQDKIHEMEAEFDKKMAELDVSTYSPEQEQEHRNAQLGAMNHTLRI